MKLLMFQVKQRSLAEILALQGPVTLTLWRRITMARRILSSLESLQHTRGASRQYRWYAKWPEPLLHIIKVRCQHWADKVPCWPLGDLKSVIFKFLLTHWGRVTHICVVKLTIIGSDNGLSPRRRQVIIWTNVGILLIGPLGTNFIDILIGIQTFSFNKMHLKMSSAKWRPFCLGLNVLRVDIFSVFLWNCPDMNAARPRWCWVNIRTGNGLCRQASSYYRKLMLTKFYDAMSQGHNVLIAWGLRY